MSNIITNLYSILEEIENNSFIGVIDLITFYKEKFIDNLFSLQLGDKCLEILQLMNKRADFDLLLEYIDKEYGLDKDVKLLFLGKYGEKYVDILESFESVSGKIPSWIKEYIRIKNGLSHEYENSVFPISLLRHVEEILEAKINESSVNVLVEAIYLRKLVRRNYDFEELLRYIKRDIQNIFANLLSILLSLGYKIEPLRTIFSKHYLDRLSFLTAEKVFLGSLTQPFILLNTRPVKYLYRKRLTVLFGDFREFFSNALWEMTNDALLFNEKENENIIIEGVYKDWIDWEKMIIHKIIYRNDKYLFETLVFPISLGNSVILLNLGVKGEKVLHRLYSELLEKSGIDVINSYHGAERCDSKFLTHKFIELYNRRNINNKILMPDYLYIPRNIKYNELKKRIKSFLEKHPVVVVKPNYGTEGWGIKVFGDDQLYNLSSYVLNLLRYQSVLIEEFVGNIFYSKDLNKLSLRVVVSFNGECFIVEGGFALIARKHEAIPSISHGGYIENINDVLINLYTDKNQKMMFTEEDLLKLYDVSKTIAHAINIGLSRKIMLKYIGIDLIPFHHNNNINYIFIEANSRPSGLTYLKRINPFNKDVPNIISGLLAYISKKDKTKTF